MVTVMIKMIIMTKPGLVQFILALALAGACSAASVHGAQLGKRYIDPTRGFSLKEPLDTVRKRGFSASRLVTWTKLDKKTNAIVWTLSLHQAISKDKDIGIERYSKILQSRLRREQKFDISSAKTITVSEKGAIDLRGVIKGPIQLWARQVWILAEPGRFIVLIMTGPIGMKQQLDETCSEVLKTFELTDPAEAILQSRNNLVRGKELLAGMNDAKLSAIVKPGHQLYLLKHKHRNVGFMYVRESWRSMDGVAGIAVETYLMLQMPKDKRRIVRRKLFSTSNGNFERWSERLATGSGKKRISSGESGIKQGPLIVCDIIQGKNTRTLKKNVPQSIYLPRATGWVLPRLVDLNKPASYSFAAYTSSENNFNMRTFTVLGPEKIETSRGQIDTIGATDRLAADAEPTKLWLSPSGMLEQMESPDGLVVTTATQQAVLALYPEARKIIPNE